MDSLVHRSSGFPWLIIVLAFFYGAHALQINAYQADNGFSPQTWILGWTII